MEPAIDPAAVGDECDPLGTRFIRQTLHSNEADACRHGLPNRFAMPLFRMNPDEPRMFYLRINEE